MRPWMLLCALFGAGCAHAHEAEVVASYEPRATIGQAFTADTTRLGGDAPASAAGEKALAELFDGQLAAVGQLRPDQRQGDHLDLVAELPAPGWALRIRVTPKDEAMCLVMIEPIALQPAEHAVDAAPWSVQEAFEQVRRRAPTLLPSKLPPMAAERFARLRAEAAAAAAEGRDPSLSPSEYVRVSRPISREGEEAPYYTPERSTEAPSPKR
ncbi:MAG TPA: hypothetical protein VF945_03760 [Polyangia bacterium]